MATKLGVSTFKATCCGQSFEGEAGATALEAHAKAEHKRRKLLPGSNVNKSITDGWGIAVGTAPGWSGGRIERPHEWKAPAVPKDWEVALARVLTAYADEIVDSDAKVADGTYRYDDETTEPPYNALPAQVANILRATVDRGERWAVKVNGSSVAVSLGRTTDQQASITIQSGRIRRVTRTRMVEGAPKWTQSAKLSDVRAMFGPDVVVTPCLDYFDDAGEARSHELTCGACAGAVEQAS